MIQRPRLRRLFQAVRQSSILPKLGSRFYLFVWVLLVLFRAFLRSVIIQKK